MSSTVFEKQDNVLTVKHTGRLDTITSPVLENELRPYLDAVQEVIMDFSKIDYISSSGLRLLLTTQEALEDHGGSMKLIHVNDLIMEILEVTGFVDILTIE